MPSTRATSPIVSNGALAGPYFRLAARYSGNSAPFGRRSSSGSRQSAIASTSVAAAASSSPPMTIEEVLQQAIRRRIDVDLRRFIDGGDDDGRVAVDEPMRLAVRLPDIRDLRAHQLERRALDGAVGDARTCASDTALRTASASVRMLNANPLAMHGQQNREPQREHQRDAGLGMRVRGPGSIDACSSSGL